MSKKSVCLLIGIVAVIAFAGGFLANRSGGKTGSTGGRTVLYYVDPMHPAYKSDKPGIAPDCGMQLEPVYADGAPGGGVDSHLPPGTVQVTPERQQLIGMKSSLVTRSPAAFTARVLGRVAPDETRVYRINASLQGFVKTISQVTTGSYVKKDEYLASVYSPDLYALINSYIFALNSIDRKNKAATPEEIRRLRNDLGVRNSRNSLINIGMSETQLDEVMKSRYNREVIDIRSTEAGFVVSRNISNGERFERGTEFYRIADLSHVWILADIFESEVSYFKPGVKVQVRLPQQNRNFIARVGSVLPLFDPVTRTMKVRLEVENSGLLLRPEMFVDVELPVTLPSMIAVPKEAILDSGMKKSVFIDLGKGNFEPRQVETGRNLGELVEVTKGLVAGERIVVSGNFLLDSESRLRTASAGIYGKPGRDPVCGMALDEEKAKSAGFTRQFGGKSWYFCSPEDMAKFDKAPQRYTGSNAVAEPMTGAPHEGVVGTKPMVHGTDDGMSGGMKMPAKKSPPFRSAMEMKPGNRRSMPEKDPVNDRSQGMGPYPNAEDDDDPAMRTPDAGLGKEVPSLDSIKVPGQQ